ncbi:MAG TPA: dihydropteroate synthase [Armatimonadota bacterium]|nr:dihydropteroate synthase [Armatimonadota bacterium]
MGGEADITAELQRMGAPPADAADITAEARLRLVKIDAVPAAAAAVVRREMSACGGRAVIGGAKDQASGCLLVGTIADFRRLCERLVSAPHGLDRAAAEIGRALRDFDTPLSGALSCGSRTLPLGERTLVMGVINATADSFSGDGLGGDIAAMIARGEAMATAGADLLDLGGESTRPGADPVDSHSEIARVVPVIEGLRRRVAAPISIDTYKPEVARAALDAGASVINDISGLRADPEMAALAAARGAPVVVMHMQGTPKTMQQAPDYDDLLGEIASSLRDSVELAERAGVPRHQVVIDPGFGFGKTVNHNLEIVRRLRELKSLGQPVLLGPSRKSTIGRVLDLPPQERLEGTLAVLALAVANGVDIVRVHDVAAAVRALRMADAVVRGWAGD